MSEEYDQTTGLPKMDQEYARAAGKKGLIGTTVAMIIFAGIGYGIAYATYIWGSTDKYDAKINQAKQQELAWPCLAVVIFGFAVIWLNIFPVFYKEQIMKGGNFRANMFIFRQAASEPSESSAVVLREDGNYGCYNRGNRSIGHFLENCLPILTTMPLGFFIYPFPSAVCLMVYAVGRMIYQVGYTSIGFGAHVPGFMMDRFSTFTMLGLILHASLKMM